MHLILGAYGKFSGYHIPGTLQTRQLETLLPVALYTSLWKWSGSAVLDSLANLARTAPAEDHHRIVAAVLRPPADWRRPAGRPRTTWLRTVNEDVQPQNFGNHTAWRKAKDRYIWPQVISTATLWKSLPCRLFQHSLIATLIRDDVLRLAKLHFFAKQRNKYLWFSAFPNFRKMGNFVASIERPKSQNIFSFRGLRTPDPQQGLSPWTPLRAPPPDPRYRLALRALAMPPLPTAKYATEYKCIKHLLTATRNEWHFENSDNH